MRHPYNISDMYGRTVEIDGEADNPNSGDVGKVIEVEYGQNGYILNVEFADGTRTFVREQEVVFYEN